jgi:hypothetical protein
MSDQVFNTSIFFKILILLYLILSLVMVLVFNELSVYFFLINFTIAIAQALSGRWIDIRVGLLLFTSLYYFGHFLHFFIIGMNDVTSGLRSDIVLNFLDYEINIQALTYVVVFQLGLLIQLTSCKINFMQFYDRYHKTGMVLSYDYFIMIKVSKPILLLIFILLLTTLDWHRISYEYTLGGTSNVFLVFYLLFAILTMSFIYRSFFLGKIPSYTFIILGIFFIVLFNYLGVRQTLFWAAIILITSGAIFSHIYKANTLSFSRNKGYFTFFLLFITLFLMLISISFLFRHQKAEMMNVLININIVDLLNAVISSFFAETRLTSYNLLSVVNENSNGHHLSFLGVLFDMLVMFVPSGLWKEKYEYIETVRFAKEYGVTPFGTWYIVGLLASSIFYPILVFTASYVYSTFLTIVSTNIFTRCNSLVVASIFYGISYVFMGVYIVRGTLSGGIKIAISLIFGIVFMNYLLKIMRYIFVQNTRKEHLKNNAK